MQHFFRPKFSNFLGESLAECIDATYTIGHNVYNDGTIFHMLTTEVDSNVCVPKVKHSRAHPDGVVVNQPAAAAAYNRSKGGVDRTTRALNSLHLFRPERKWTERHFVGTMGITVLDIHLIWKQQWSGDQQLLSDFALELGYDLVQT